MHFVRECNYRDHTCSRCKRKGHKEGYCSMAGQKSAKQVEQPSSEDTFESKSIRLVKRIGLKISHQHSNEANAPVQTAEQAVSIPVSSDNHTGLSRGAPGFHRCQLPSLGDTHKHVESSSCANTGKLDAHPRTVAIRTFRKLTQFSHRIVPSRLLPEPTAERDLQHLAEGGKAVTSLHANVTWIKSTYTDRGPHLPWLTHEDKHRVQPDSSPLALPPGPHGGGCGTNTVVPPRDAAPKRPRRRRRRRSHRSQSHQRRKDYLKVVPLVPFKLRRSRCGFSRTVSLKGEM